MAHRLASCSLSAQALPSGIRTVLWWRLFAAGSRFYDAAARTSPSVDIANVHLVGMPRLQPTAQLARLASHLQPLDQRITFMLGGFNFLTPGEGRFDPTTGVHTYDDSPVVCFFKDTFPMYAEVRAEGYSRR